MMTGVKAFVGHSFASEDDIVVREILDYFNEIKRVTDFDWVNAIGPEPRVVADKVMALFDSANTFIGICTRSERVDGRKKLKFAAGIVFGLGSEIQWKTSDWVLQEIGFAIGRGLRVILLLEDGVRKPGGIQSDLEYIPFNRRAVSNCFPKILAMLSSIAPRLPKTMVAVAKDGDNEKSADAPGSRNASMPSPTWAISDYEIAFMNALLEEGSERTEEVSAAFLASKLASDDNASSEWKAWAEFLKFKWDRGGSIERVKAVVEEFPGRSAPLRYLASAYEKYSDYSKAAENYLAAAKCPVSDEERITIFGEAALAYVKDKNIDECNAIVRIMKETVFHADKGERNLIIALRLIAELKEDKTAILALAERQLEIDSTDVAVRFSLGYQYGQNSRDELSLYHYLRIPEGSRDAMTSNNLGATYEQLGMPARSVQEYLIARDKGETLAFSNLANKYESVGFVQEAEALCREAQKVKGYSNNVDQSLMRIGQIREKDDEKEKAALTRAHSLSSFFQKYGYALIQSTPTNIQGIWVGPDCQLTISVDGSIFVAQGDYALAGGLGALSSILISPEQKSKIYTIVYRGTLNGQAIEGEVVRRAAGEPLQPSLLSFPSKVLIYMQGMNLLQVMEETGSSVSHYSISRLPTQPSKT